MCILAFMLFLLKTHQQCFGIKGGPPVCDKSEHRPLIAVTRSIRQFKIADRRQTGDSGLYTVIDVSDSRAAGIAHHMGNEIAALIRSIHYQHGGRESK